MTRPPRPDLPGLPQHVVQRGNNRLPCFLDDADRERYLHCLREALAKYPCALHAYVLMDNHVHLLLTPDAPGALPRFMQNFGRAYARLFNTRHARTGTLWEGRYKACLVDTDQYLLACYRYIELNPVRAGLVARPEHYPWSSCRHNGLWQASDWLTPHPTYLDLGRDEGARRAAYRSLLELVLPSETQSEIRSYLNQRGALGSSKFRREMEEKLRRFAGVRPAHRPARKGASKAG